MPDEVSDAIVAALKDTKVKETLAASVQSAIDEKLKVSLPDVVKGAILGARDAAKEKPDDPYRTTLHFLAGLIAFSLTIIVGVFNALPDPPVDTSHAVHRMLGGVLGWMAITAFIATLAALATQIMKNLRYQGVHWGVLLFLMLAPAFPGAMAVVYCVRGGAAMRGAKPELIGFGEALCRLWPF